MITEKTIRSMVRKVINEDRPLNNLGDLPPDEKIDQPTVHRSPKLIRINDVRFGILPDGGITIANQKNKITIDDETAKKIANLIFRIIGK